MSFGASPSDIIIVVTFCRALYRRCKEAGGEYLEISREVRGLHTVLRHLKYEVEAPESLLNRDRSIYSRELAPIIGDCDHTLRELDNLLQKYGRLLGDKPTAGRLWDNVRFGSNEMDKLGGIRVKLISHKTGLTLFLDTIQLHESGKMATALSNHGGQLDVILDKVDGIAARMGQRVGSVMTSYDDDDKEVWKQFRRELVAEGFSSDVLQQHKDVLRAYIREIDQKGLLDEMPPDTPVAAATIGVNPERWLKSVESTTSEEVSPSFDSLNAATDDSGAKEMVAREENMKFPQSMKNERPRPETRTGGDSQKQLTVPDQSRTVARRQSNGSQRMVSPVPKLITSLEDDLQHSDDSGSVSGDSAKRSQSSTPRAIIRTSDLFPTDASSRALQVRSSSSPTSFRSQDSFEDEEVTRSMAYRPKSQTEYGSSPSRPGAIPIQQRNVQSLNGGYGTSPRPESVRLAPDSFGNEIPPDAEWTKIKRSLVSPEVLDQDRRRYEARPNFVAVLGVLSWKEIEDYAARSHELRRTRRRRHNPQPVQTPRPVQRAPEPRAGRDMPSEDEDERSSGEERVQRPRFAEHRSYPSTQSRHSNYGWQGPPTPVLSPASITPQPIWMNQPPPNQAGQAGVWIPASPQHGQMYYPASDKEMERSRRRHSSPTRRSSHSSYSKGGDHKEKGRSRWKENLTAAGIGGAAVSLLSVLSEAAEGL